METNSDYTIILKHFSFLLSASLVILFIVFYMRGQLPMNKGELADPDCYMRLNRVVQLHESGKWYDSNYARSNTPFGESLHWTRPLDVLLLTGAWLASPLLADFKTGLFWWGVLISPVLLIASLMTIPWAFRPIIDNDSRLMSLLLVFQFGAIIFYSVGRPDHHSLLGFIFIVSTGLMLRLILGSFNKTICYIAGMAGAFSLWLHVESLIPVFWGLLLIGCFWISDDKDFVDKNLHYSIALLVLTGIALILERPWHDLARIEYDRISLVHFFIFGLITLFWIAVFHFRSLLSRQGRNFRVAIAFLGLASVAVPVWVLFPDFYHGGCVNIDPRIVPVWLNKIVEVQSPLNRDFLMPLIQLLCSAITGIFYIAFILRTEPDKDLRGWIFILSGILLFTSAAIFERRLLLYGNIITLAPLAVILGRVLRWEIEHVKLLFRTCVLLFTVLSFCAAFILFGSICEKITHRDSALKEKERPVPLSQMCDKLNELAAGQVHKTRILAAIHSGPEILFRTGYEVVGTPYHRNSQGIMDTFKIMAAESDEEAHELILGRNINMILLSNDPGERNFIPAVLGKSTFYERLRTEDLAYWLRAVELSPHLSASYRLFRVIG